MSRRVLFVFCLLLVNKQNDEKFTKLQKRKLFSLRVFDGHSYAISSRLGFRLKRTLLMYEAGTVFSLF